MARRLTRFEIRREAARDRRHDLPSPSATALSPTEQRIQAAANAGIRSLEHNYFGRAERLKSDLTATTDRLEHSERPEWARFVEATGRRQEDLALSPFAHFALMVLLTVGEMAFNVSAFAVVGEATVFSLAVAMGVAIAIPLLAHATGVALRQYEPLARKLRWVGALSLVVGTALVAINQLRGTYLRAIGTSTVSSSWTSTTTSYFLINISVYVAAVFVTYLSKDTVAGFTEAKSKVSSSEARVAKLCGTLNQLRAELTQAANMQREAGLQAIALYRSVNRRGRQHAPRYFDDDQVPHHRVEFVELTPDPALRATAAAPVWSPATPRVVRLRGVR